MKRLALITDTNMLRFCMSPPGVKQNIQRNGHGTISLKSSNFKDSKLFHDNKFNMRYAPILFVILSLLFWGCSEQDAPKSREEQLIGYWTLTNIKTIEQVGESHQTSNTNVPPSMLEDGAGDDNTRWNVLIFDEDFVTVRGDMPSRPKYEDYDQTTPEGQLSYISDREEWLNSIGTQTDQFACPVGTYAIKGHDLIVGGLNMGVITFISDDMFTLDYKKAIGNNGDYRRSIYTYSRI